MGAELINLIYSGYLRNLFLLSKAMYKWEELIAYYLDD